MIEKICQILLKLPKWARIFVISLLVIAAGVSIFYSLPSCSSVKSVIYGEGEVSTSVNQSGADSTQVIIKLKH